MAAMTETTYEALLKETIELISRHYRREVTEDTHLAVDLNLDSLDIAELVAEMEDHFQVMIPMQNLPEIRTVGDIVRALAELVNDPSRVRGV